MVMTAMGNGRSLLEIQDIYAGYVLDIDILKGVSLHVKPGEVVCVIGPNGAGKSTVFKALYGFLTVRQGRVLFDNRDITNIRAAECPPLWYHYRPAAAQRFPPNDRLRKSGTGHVSGK